MIRHSPYCLQGVFTVWEETPEVKTTSRGHQRQVFLFRECIVLCKLKRDTNVNCDTYTFKNKMKVRFSVLLKQHKSLRLPYCSVLPKLFLASSVHALTPLTFATYPAEWCGDKGDCRWRWEVLGVMAWAQGLLAEVHIAGPILPGQTPLAERPEGATATIQPANQQWVFLQEGTSILTHWIFFPLKFNLLWFCFKIKMATKAVHCLPTGPPVFELLLSDWSAKIGQTIKLTCKVTGSPKPVVSWLKGPYYLRVINTYCTDTFLLHRVASYLSYTHCRSLRWPSFRGRPSSHHFVRPVRDLHSCPGQPHCTGLWTVCLLREQLYGQCRHSG